MSSLRTNPACETADEALQLAERLLAWFSPTQPYVVALSGGVDSAVVAKAAALACCEPLAVTARSPSVAQRELHDARQLAATIGIRHTLVEPGELADAAYQQNDARRCYYCKSHLYAAIAAHFPQHVVLSGTNYDDLGDYRPGLQAASEAHVRSPLAELQMGKPQVRQLAQRWHLHVADKPASPCLASRIAHGVEVTAERLQRIEQAEELLRRLGLVEFRVRLHAQELARIEVAPQEIARLAAADVRQALVSQFQQLGFRYVSLDLEGFRSGSLNPVFQIEAAPL